MSVTPGVAPRTSAMYWDTWGGYYIREKSSRADQIKIAKRTKAEEAVAVIRMNGRKCSGKDSTLHEIKAMKQVENILANH